MEAAMAVPAGADGACARDVSLGPSRTRTWSPDVVIGRVPSTSPTPQKME